MKIPKLSKIVTNDFTRVSRTDLAESISQNGELTLSYLLLLAGASVVTTLGLLINNPAVVIGGMIISPLVWPLMKVSMGIIFEKRDYIKEAIQILLASIFISLCASMLITFISPIKGLNTEIIARTNPTLIDLIIALVSGAVAGLSLMIPKISQSLAGVAIATSLMPPLCVTGIGLVLGLPNVSFTSFTLFIANALAIIFVCSLVFNFGSKFHSHDQAHLRRKAILILSSLIVIISIPLFIFLQSFTFKTTAVIQAQNILNQNLKILSPEIIVQDVRTDVIRRGSGEIVSVSAEVMIPDDVTIDYLQKQNIILELEKVLEKKVDLNLILSRTISIATEDDLSLEQQRQELIAVLTLRLPRMADNTAIETFRVSKQTNAENVDSWKIDCVISTTDSSEITSDKRQVLIKYMKEKTDLEIEFSLRVLPQIEITD